MKKCRKCKVEKPLSEFTKSSRQKDGLDYYCKPCKSSNWEQYRSNPKNKNKHLKYNRNYYQQNKETHSQRTAQWYQEHKQWFREYYREYDKEWVKINRKRYPHLYRWRSLLSDSLKRLDTPKQDSTHQLLGYSALELKEHLDKQGMDWDKHQVDHKIPISWFKDNTPPHIVNDLRNLQPLTEEENKSKSNRFCSPIEDSYIQLIEKWVKPQYKNKIA